MELLIGAGSNRNKRIAVPENPGWKKLVTLDFNSDHNPDISHNLEDLPLPFEDNTFEEIHAYEVLEHIGKQGDWKFFFDQWTDFWRILKPNGFFCGTSPMGNSVWAWGDPGHSRIVSRENFVFLNQPQYVAQVGKSPMSDYRFHYKADFEPMHLETTGESFVYVLQAVKPSRIAK